MPFRCLMKNVYFPEGKSIVYKIDIGADGNIAKRYEIGFDLQSKGNASFASFFLGGLLKFFTCNYVGQQKIPAAKSGDFGLKTFISSLYWP